MNSISARANLNEINYFPINFLSYKWNSGIDMHIEADNSRRALFSIIWQHIKGKWSHFFLFMRGPLQLKYVKYGLLILKKSGSFVEITYFRRYKKRRKGISSSCSSYHRSVLSQNTSIAHLCACKPRESRAKEFPIAQKMYKLQQRALLIQY